MNFEEQEYIYRSLQIEYSIQCRTCGYLNQNLSSTVTDSDEIDEFYSTTDYISSNRIEEKACCEDCGSFNVQIYNLRLSGYPCFRRSIGRGFRKILQNSYLLEISVSKTQFDDYRKEVLSEPHTVFNDFNKVIPVDFYIKAIQKIFKELQSSAPTKFIPLSSGLFNVQISGHFDSSVNSFDVSIESMFYVGLDRDLILNNIVDEFNRRKFGVSMVR